MGTRSNLTGCAQARRSLEEKKPTKYTIDVVAKGASKDHGYSQTPGDLSSSEIVATSQNRSPWCASPSDEKGSNHVIAMHPLRPRLSRNFTVKLLGGCLSEIYMSSVLHAQRGALHYKSPTKGIYVTVSQYGGVQNRGLLVLSQDRNIERRTPSKLKSMMFLLSS